VQIRLAGHCHAPTHALVSIHMQTSHYRADGSGAHQRRSQRVVLSLSIMVRSDASAQAPPFEEATQTLVVNAHGALIALMHRAEKGQTLWLTNRATKAEQLCKVMYLGPVSGGKSQVGIEFIQPCPDFWRIAFPPEDWTLPEQMGVTENDQ
jgi:hypothetical protein